MGDFFHGWRQKAGCVALTMELVVFAAWMRSDDSPDSFGEKQSPWLISHDGNIVLASQSGPYNYPLIWDWYGFYTTDPAIFAQGYRRGFEWKCVSRRASVGLELGRHEFRGVCRGLAARPLRDNPASHQSSLRIPDSREAGPNQRVTTS